MKNLMLIFLLAPFPCLLAQVPPKPNTNAVAQVVTLVGTNIMPTAVRPIVEGWFVAGVTTQDVESAISARGYTTTNDVLALIPSSSITTQDVENVINAKGYTTTNDVLNLIPSTAGFVSETDPAYTNLLTISAMALRVYETNGVWKTLLPGETLP